MQCMKEMKLQESRTRMSSLDGAFENPFRRKHLHGAGSPNYQNETPETSIIIHGASMIRRAVVGNPSHRTSGKWRTNPGKLFPGEHSEERSFQSEITRHGGSKIRRAVVGILDPESWSKRQVTRKDADAVGNAVGSFWKGLRRLCGSLG